MPQPDAPRLPLQPEPLHATPEQWASLLALHDEWALSRVLHHLTQDPIIVVAGAYQGKLMQYFAELYPKAALIAGYEPADWAYHRAASRLAPYPNWELYTYGLGTNDTPTPTAMFAWGTDECTFLPHPDTEAKPMGVGIVKEAKRALVDMLTEHFPLYRAIDLLVINMEGYEYVLLPHLLEGAFLRYQVKSVAVQFHTKYQPSPSHHLALLHDLDVTYPNHIHHSLPSWGYWYV